MSPPPAKTLDDAYKLCDPSAPLHPVEDNALREDLAGSRGGERIQRIARGIRRSGGTPAMFFLAGHVGSGKTTELLRMRSSFEANAVAESLNTVLYLDANRSLDIYDVDMEDIMVALWDLLYRERPKVAAKVLGPLWEQQISEALKNLAIKLPSEAAAAISQLTGHLKTPGVDQRPSLRLAIGSVLSSLIEGLNQALFALQEDAPGLVIVLIDNLEKMAEGNQANVEHLYLTRMSALRRLQAHLVITVPYYLCYSAAGAGLAGAHGTEMVVLPAVKVRRRRDEGGGDDPQGLQNMVALLRKRVDFAQLFEDGEEAARTIARSSGGCIRHALRMVQDAINEHEDPPVTRASVDRAVARLRADFERALPGAWLPLLQHVAQHNHFPDSCQDDVKKQLLRHLYVLEYQNGEPEPWQDIHPIVEACGKYRGRPERTAG